MLTLVAAFILGHQVNISRTYLPNPFGPKSQLEVEFRPDLRLNPPKLSPKMFGVGKDAQPFEFDFATAGLAAADSEDNLHLRFQVFEQQRTVKNDVALGVTRMLLRLWEYNFRHLKLDHSKAFNLQTVDVYLCWGGNPGGEQLYAADPQLKKGQDNVNTIYIYDLPSFTQPVEMAREVAHEYGHASLYPVGGYTSPEEWSNGYLGERLFLTYLRDELQKGELKPEDAMGATAEDLDKWVKKNVEPLVQNAASAPPNLAQLGQKGQSAMNAYIGLALYCSALLPDAVVQRTWARLETIEAKALPEAILNAIEEPESIKLTIPPYLAGKPIWVPISKARIFGASVVSLKGGWALIKPTGGTVTLRNEPPSSF